MDFRFSEAQERLRREICGFLATELGTNHDSDPHAQPPSYMPARDFERKLGERGWLGMAWPVEYGGRGRSLIEQFIVDEEVALHGGPASEALARVIVAPALLQWGSDDQKRRYLPPIARGESAFCLGYTEPESGSDLASLKTKAVRDGEFYRITGRKLYTSSADASEYCWLAARTDPAAPKQAGISVFVVPMRAPGVQVRPLMNLLGERWFNEVAFDEVEVPESNLVGGENKGWQILTSALGIERLTIYRPFAHLHTFWALVRHVREISQGNGSGKTIAARLRLAQLWIEFQVARLLLYRGVQMLEEGKDVRAQASMVKLFSTEWAQRLYQAGLSVLGPEGFLVRDDQRAACDGAIPFGYLSATQDTIGAGTSEVQREIIALRWLGLPRG